MQDLVGAQVQVECALAGLGNDLRVPLGGVGREVYVADEVGGEPDGLANSLWALRDEPPGTGARRAPRQRPHRLYPVTTGVGQYGRVRALVHGVLLATTQAAGALVSAGRASCATFTSTANAGASFTARSAITRRSTSTPAIFRPWMNRLYVMPLRRAAALIRWIHSLRKSPLRALRSR